MTTEIVRNMAPTLSITVDRFPIAGSFRISRGAKTEAAVVLCTLRDGDAIGRGECVPYNRYGETIESVVAQIEAIRGDIEAGVDRAGLRRRMAAGAARNAVDCALWDLEAKRSGERTSALICQGDPLPLVTAYTLSLDTPEAMAAQASAVAWRRLLKIKVGQPGDRQRIEAVAQAAPGAALILDANEGWQPSTLQDDLDHAAAHNAVLVEQPLPAGNDAALAAVRRSVPVCADESLHVADDLDALRDRYDAVNIKLDKTGGLTEALLLRDRARALGYRLMVGCMVGTSLAMAPAVLLAQGADFVDLDGPLLLSRDRDPALTYSGDMVSPPDAGLWG